MHMKNFKQNIWVLVSFPRHKNIIPRRVHIKVVQHMVMKTPTWTKMRKFCRIRNTYSLMTAIPWCRTTCNKITNNRNKTIWFWRTRSQITLFFMFLRHCMSKNIIKNHCTFKINIDIAYIKWTHFVNKTWFWN